jgi:hypothetical protein
VPKAIVIVEEEKSVVQPADLSAPLSQNAIRHSALPSVEILGQSVVRRTIDTLVRCGLESITVFSGSLADADGFTELPQVVLFSPRDLWEGAMKTLAEHREGGTDAVLILGLGAYVEFDPNDAFQFHREKGSSAVRGFDEQGPLNFWIVDPAQVPDGSDLISVLQQIRATNYPVQGYINRLEGPADLRRLVVDSFNADCRLRPHGFEVRPGVWMGEGAQIEKDARLVAPVFIGRAVTIAQQALITRCSNVERNSHVDYGTVVEDSSVLVNTYVGIGLELSHSIVDGDNLLNLHHGVLVQIADAAVMRPNKSLSGTIRHLWTGFGLDERASAN